MTLISMINYIRQTKVSNRYTSFLGTSSIRIVLTNFLCRSYQKMSKNTLVEFIISFLFVGMVTTNSVLLKELLHLVRQETMRRRPVDRNICNSYITWLLVIYFNLCLDFLCMKFLELYIYYLFMYLSIWKSNIVNQSLFTSFLVSFSCHEYGYSENHPFSLPILPLFKICNFLKIGETGRKNLSRNEFPIQFQFRNMCQKSEIETFIFHHF